MGKVIPSSMVILSMGKSLVEPIPSKLQSGGRENWNCVELSHFPRVVDNVVDSTLFNIIIIRKYQ